jgi:hypothetical protein
MIVVYVGVMTMPWLVLVMAVLVIVVVYCRRPVRRMFMRTPRIMVVSHDRTVTSERFPGLMTCRGISLLKRGLGLVQCAEVQELAHIGRRRLDHLTSWGQQLRLHLRGRLGVFSEYALECEAGDQYQGKGCPVPIPEIRNLNKPCHIQRPIRGQHRVVDAR